MACMSGLALDHRIAYSSTGITWLNTGTYSPSQVRQRTATPLAALDSALHSELLEQHARAKRESESPKGGHADSAQPIRHALSNCNSASQSRGPVNASLQPERHKITECPQTWPAATFLLWSSQHGAARSDSQTSTQTRTQE